MTRDVLVQHVDKMSRTTKVSQPHWWHNYITYYDRETYDYNLTYNDFIAYVRNDLNDNYNVKLLDEITKTDLIRWLRFSNNEDYVAFMLRWS